MLHLHVQKNTTQYMLKIRCPSIQFLPVHTNTNHTLMLNSVATSNSQNWTHSYAWGEQVQLTVLGQRDFVRRCLCCLSTIVTVRVSKGLAYSPTLALAHYVGWQQGILCDDHLDHMGARRKLLTVRQCLRYLSKASNPITQLEQHSHISKP